jgi:hypothetical protein
MLRAEPVAMIARKKRRREVMVRELAANNSEQLMMKRSYTKKINRFKHL